MKAAFIDLGALADLVNAHAAITAVPNEPKCDIQKLLLGITCASYKIIT